MRAVNRTLLFVVPKKPFFDWAKSIDGESVPESDYRTAYLIPETYNETNYKAFVRKHFKSIFEEELISEYTDSALWPQTRDYKTFINWFEVQACDMVYDLGKEPLAAEDFE